tara:strand:+ start:19 stop:852 length:834 start_codon:yes stop_codon:yes gene_type:complete
VKYDERITPIKKNLAHRAYKTIIKKKKYVKGSKHTVIKPFTPLYNKLNSKLSTQLLFGEECIVLEKKNKWSWIQSLRDQYVGYTPTENLSRSSLRTTHKVFTLRTFVYKKPDIKSESLGYLSFNSLLQITAKTKRFSKIKNFGWIPTSSITALNNYKLNIVSLANQYLDTPYLWGGRDSMGIDCSGLIQNLFQIKNIRFPRDTDMQEIYVTREILKKNLRAGDLVFWKGHVAMMVDNRNIIHANAFHMKTAIEPLSVAQKRIFKTNGPVKKFGRVTS